MFVAGQRAKNKVQIGAYIDLETEAGIHQWMQKYPRKTKTDFLFEAIVAKLENEKIILPHQAGSRQHLKRPKVIFNTSAAQLNEINSAGPSEAAKLLDAAEATIEHPAPKRTPK